MDKKSARIRHCDPRARRSSRSWAQLAVILSYPRDVIFTLEVVPNGSPEVLVAATVEKAMR